MTSRVEKLVIAVQILCLLTVATVLPTTTASAAGLTTTVISQDAVLTQKGTYPFAGIYEYGNLTLNDGVHVTSSGISQLVIHRKGYAHQGLVE